MRARIVIVAITLVAAAVCGGKSPTGPSGTQPTATPTALAINPSTDLLKIKGVETFSATATLSDGSSRTVQATWTSNNTDVATVDSSAGRATGVGPGEATVAADHQGLRATRLLRVVPDYHGKWGGEHAITSCTDDGVWEDACQEFAAGSVFWFDLALTQTRDVVTGTTDFGTPGPADGTIRLSGHLVLTGTFTESVEDMTLETTLASWETLTTDNERMTGRFTLQFRVPGLAGSVRIENDLLTVNKTSATPLVGGGEGRGPRRLSAAVVNRLRRR